MHKTLSIIAPTTVIVLLALARLVPHMPNFAPITAMALFGAVYLSRRYAFVVPMLAMVLSDYLLLYVHPFSSHLFDFSHLQPIQALFHSALPAVYASFLISGLAGIWLKDRVGPVNVVLVSAFCSIQFFLITNAAVWIVSDMYPHTVYGLALSYVAGLPFLQGTLFGDFFYTCSLFGGYELATRLVKRRRLALAH